VPDEAGKRPITDTDVAELRLLVSDRPASGLDKLQKIAAIAASILVPVVLLIFGAVINGSIKERELAVKYVEIAIGVLNQPKTEQNQATYDWAIEVVNKYAGVKLPKEAIAEIEQGEPLTRPSDETCAANYTPADNGRSIKYLIVTDTESPSLAAVRRSVCRENANASYHYVIGVDGSVENLVPDQHIAWHAGRSAFGGDSQLNNISIGIGLVHLATADGENWLKLDKSHPAVGPDYTPAQIEALTALLLELASKNEILPENIVTKQDVAPNRRRTDLFGAKIGQIRKTIETQLN